MVRKEPRPHDWREWRRFRALGLDLHGWRHGEIAEALGVDERSVRRWLNRAEHEGVTALFAHPSPGCPAELTSEQKRLIPDFLWHGAEAYGFQGEFWSCARVASVLKEEFGVQYHPGHVSRILKDLGWTPQIPITRALQRDEEEIARWRRDVWPELVQRAARERRTLVFVDESGFYLLPSVVRTYAPQGQTPVLHQWQTRDHLSAFGGITPDGRFYTLARQESLNGTHVIAFLNHLLRYAHRWLVIWDRSPIHRRTEVQQHACQIPRRRIHLELLPAYAPDLNPIEWAWRYLKHVELRNHACRDVEDVHQEFYLAIARLRRKRRILKSFFAAAELTTNPRAKTGLSLRNAQ